MDIYIPALEYDNFFTGFSFIVRECTEEEALAQISKFEADPASAIGRCDSSHDGSIHRACVYGWNRLLKKLLETIPLATQERAVDIAIQWSRCSSITKAMDSGNWEAVVILLDFNQCLYGRAIDIPTFKTPNDVRPFLTILCMYGPVAVCKRFVRGIYCMHNADPDWAVVPVLPDDRIIEIVDFIYEHMPSALDVDPTEWEPDVFVAFTCHSVEVIKHIVSYLPPDFCSTTTNRLSQTVAHRAVLREGTTRCNAEVVLYLLHEHPELASARNDKGQTPLDLLRLKADNTELHPEIRAILNSSSSSMAKSAHA